MYRNKRWWSKGQVILYYIVNWLSQRSPLHNPCCCCCCCPGEAPPEEESRGGETCAALHHFFISPSIFSAHFQSCHSFSSFSHILLLAHSLSLILPSSVHLASPSIYFRLPLCLLSWWPLPSAVWAGLYFKPHFKQQFHSKANFKAADMEMDGSCCVTLCILSVKQTWYLQEVTQLKIVTGGSAVTTYLKRRSNHHTAVANGIMHCRIWHQIHT